MLGPHRLGAGGSREPRISISSSCRCTPGQRSNSATAAVARRAPLRRLTRQRDLCCQASSGPTNPQDSNGATLQASSTTSAGQQNGASSVVSEPPPAAQPQQPQQLQRSSTATSSTANTTSSAGTAAPAAAQAQSQQPPIHHQPQQQDEQLSVQQLTSNVQTLLSTVCTQQETLQQQQAELQQLRQTVQQLQQQQQTQLQQQQAPDHQQQQQEAGVLQSGSGGGGSSGVQSDAAQALLDRRQHGMFDARYHSTSRAAAPRDSRVLPDRIILVRHAQSEGNVNQAAYTYLPDPQVPLTALGREQAQQAGEAIRQHMEALHGGGGGGGNNSSSSSSSTKSAATDYKLYFYTSPYKRGVQTYEGIRAAFDSSQVLGVQEDVQLREQDFGNFQRVEDKQREKEERLRFGRFFYRFPNGESGADVYDRMTVFMDHLVRDINAGRFPPNTSLVLVTHGLALRIWLMRWFHWTVDDFMDVFNPPNAVPLILERIDNPMGDSGSDGASSDSTSWVHTKAMYRFSPDSMKVLRGVTPDMCATSPLPPGSTWAGSTSGGGGSVVAGSSSGSSVDAALGDAGGIGESAAEQWAELGGGW